METNQLQTSKSVAKNVFYGFLTWILPLGLSFTATPFIIKTLGDKDYGIYALVLGFIGYSFTFSIGRAITKYVAEYRVGGEHEKIRNLISATFFINIVIGLFGVILIFATGNQIVETVFKIGGEDQEKTVKALYIAAAIIFFTILNQVFSSVLQGIHRFDVYSKIYNASSFALLLGNLVFAWLGFGLLTLLNWNLLIICITCAVYLVGAKKLLPEFGITPRFGREMFGLVLKYSYGVVGYQILGNVVLLFERSWIIRQLGAESLTYYVVPMTLGFYIHGFMASLTQVLFPLASEIKENKEKLLRIYTKATKIACFLIVFLAASLIIESNRFLALWLGSEFAEKSSNLLVMHTITFALAAILTVSWQMVEGLGYANFNFAIIIVWFICSIVLMVALTPGFGNFGIAFARLVGFAVIFFSIFYVEKWIFGQIQTKFWLTITAKLTAAAFLGAITEKFLITNLPLSWLSLFSAVFTGGIVYCVFLLFTNYFTTEEKQLFKGMIGK